MENEQRILWLESEVLDLKQKIQDLESLIMFLKQYVPVPEHVEVKL